MLWSPTASSSGPASSSNTPSSTFTDSGEVPPSALTVTAANPSTFVQPDVVVTRSFVGGSWNWTVAQPGPQT